MCLMETKTFCINLSVQSLSRIRLFETPWTAARQASLSCTNSWSLLKLMSIESVVPSNHLILCHPLLLLPSVFPSIKVFSNESVLCMKWHQSFQWILRVDFPWDWLVWSPFCPRDSQESALAPQFGAQPSLWSSSHICTWLLKKP